jgi:DNA polymerase
VDTLRNFSTRIRKTCTGSDLSAPPGAMDRRWRGDCSAHGMPERTTKRAPRQRAGGVEALRRAANRCGACPLWKPATQTVFGAGPDDASIMLVGEQAGDREDLEGLPFVGPAGRLLDQALDEIGIDRDALYVTNVIKHFKFELRGKRRLHKRANAAEIDACLRWLDGELAGVDPRYVVCLGAMASRVMLGPGFRLLRERGDWRRLEGGRWCLATVHPSAVLRSRIAGDYDAAYAAFVADLGKLKRLPK